MSDKIGILVEPDEYAINELLKDHSLHTQAPQVILYGEDYPKMDISQTFRIAASYGLVGEPTLNAPWYAGANFGRCKYNKARTLRAKARHKRKKKCSR